MLNNEISDKLDIFIITYNRALALKNTLKVLFDENSPVKNFEITVIDNNSNDNTSAVVKSFMSDFLNLKYKKNRFNIGGNANIVNAFLLSKKKYVWILCDDDYYCWDNWKEVEEAIKNDEDAIVVSNNDAPKLNVAQLFGQTSFLPAVIYKTSNIDENVIINMQFNISNMFPHMAIAAKLINENKTFKIISKPIVYFEYNKEPVSGIYTRGISGYIHPFMKQMSYLVGYVNTLYFIKDKKKRNFILNKRRFIFPTVNSAEIFFYNSQKHGGSLYNILCIFCALNVVGKIRFIINWILFNTIYKILYFYKNETFNQKTSEVTVIIGIRLFYFIKTKLFKMTRKVKGAY